MNYADKRKEFDQHNPAPTLFVRFPDSQTGHNEPVLNRATPASSIMKASWR
jgi:2-keto-4-pentenoate hydratase/2-oxohepta-3-ene-1,7-dioic acid hydratase in catechol pathway